MLNVVTDDGIPTTGGPCPFDMGETMTYGRCRSPSGPHSGPYKNGDAIRDDRRLPHLQRRWATQPQFRMLCGSV